MGSTPAENTEVVVEGTPRVSAWDRLFLFTGASCSAAGLVLQGAGMQDGSHSFGLKLAAIICSGLGAGCIAVAPSVRGGLKT